MSWAPPKNHIFWNDFSWFTDQQHFYYNNHDLLQLFTASHPFEQYDLNFRDKFGFEVNIANIVNTLGVRWSLSLSYYFSELIACSVFWHISWKLLEDTEFCFRCERVQSTAWTCRLGINLKSWYQPYFEYFSHFLHCGHSFIQTSGLFGEPMLRIMGTPLILGIEAF